MRNSQQFRGTGVALVTPFKNHEVDYDALASIIEYNIESGIDYLVSLGTTGEAVTLTNEEQINVLNFTIAQTKGRVPVVVGIGGNDTLAVLKQFECFDFTNVAGVLSSSPAYNKPTQEGIFQHYMAIAKISPVPIIIYNVPGRTSSNILPKTTVRLAHASKRFVAIKEASSDLRQGAYVIKHRPDDFLVLSGDDETSLGLLGMGSDGVISVIANAYPSAFSELTHAALKGDFKTAQFIHRQLLDIHHWLYVEGNPSGIKACMEIKGFCSKEMRLPLIPLSDDSYLKLKTEMDKLVEKETYV